MFCPPKSQSPRRSHKLQVIESQVQYELLQSARLCATNCKSSRLTPVSASGPRHALPLREHYRTLGLLDSKMTSAQLALIAMPPTRPGVVCPNPAPQLDMLKQHMCRHWELAAGQGFFCWSRLLSRVAAALDPNPGPGPQSQRLGVSEHTAQITTLRDAGILSAAERLPSPPLWPRAFPPSSDPQCPQWRLPFDLAADVSTGPGGFLAYCVHQFTQHCPKSCP